MSFFFIDFIIIAATHSHLFNRFNFFLTRLPVICIGL